MWRKKKDFLAKVRDTALRNQLSMLIPASIWRSHILRLGRREQILNKEQTKEAKKGSLNQHSDN